MEYFLDAPNDGEIRLPSLNLLIASSTPEDIEEILSGEACSPPIACKISWQLPFGVIENIGLWAPI